MTSPVNTLRDDPVLPLLDRLHGAARGDRIRFLRLVPRLLLGFARGRSFAETITPAAMRDFYIPVSREQGEFLYLTSRALDARHVVEFGT